MIDKLTVERIMDAADMWMWVGDFVSLRKRGATIWRAVRFMVKKPRRFPYPHHGVFLNVLVAVRQVTLLRLL